MKARWKVAASAFVLSLTLASTAMADTPLVASVTATPTSINNDHMVALSWDIPSGSGHSLYITCPIGVTLKLPDGSAFPCNTRRSVSVSASDNVGLTVTNVSGTPKTLTATVYPKDASGADYDNGAKSTTFTVDNAQQPILDFSTSSTSPVSGLPVTFTWHGIDIPGANMSFDCSNDVSVYASDPKVAGTVALPCGVPAFKSDLAQSGSVTVYLKSTATDQAPLTARMVPTMAVGAYDNTHSVALVLRVLPTPVSAILSPTISDFRASAKNLASGELLTLSWDTSNTMGANIEFDCPADVNVFIGTSTNPLGCNMVAYNPALSSSGTTTVNFVNSTYSPLTIPILMIPQGNDNIYNRYYARVLSVVVYPTGWSVPASAPTNVATTLGGMPTTPTTPATTPATPTVTAPPHAPFTIWLSRGLRGAQVTALQKFLALNPDIYPEGMVTGYYGAATERAVQRFQVKYGIAKAGAVAYGSVGPNTRAKLNSLLTP